MILRSVLAFLSIICLSVAAPTPSAVVDLGGVWALANGAGNVTTVGSVPGQVHTDLMAAGIIQDPYFGFRDMEYLWIPYDDWTYSRSFKLGDLPQGSTVLLVAEGIDTAASIQINGQVVGTTNNMFRRYVTDITSAVTSAENKITVSIQSAVTYSADQAKQYPYVVPWSNGIPPYLSTNLGSRNFIRKEQCQFGWDWGPAFMTLGIWKPIYVVVYQSAYLKDVVSRTYRDAAGDFSLVVDVYLEGPSSPSGFVDVSSGSLSVELSGNGLAPLSNGSTVAVFPGENKFTVTLSPQDVQLWWPNGYGSPVLYNLTVSFADDSGQDAWTRSVNVGFRTVQLVTDPVGTEPGKHFYFKVNDVPIFIKGANWIPSDAFESRVNSSTLWNLMSSALAANMNTLRVWGGGIYQHDAFYDLADQHGILVWQEFLFACAMYPRDGPFLDNVKQEIRDTIRRLSNHPSIFLWSGNNENEGALYWYPESLQNIMLYTVDYYTLTVETEMPTVQQEDDSRPFWPSSPSNGFVSTDPLVGAWGNVQDPTQGDVHFYNYEMNCYDVSNYPRSRFASEYGFQSYPSLYTLSTVLAPSDYSFNSTAMLHRQHHTNGTLQLIDEVTQHFHWAAGGSQQESFENAIYLTQAMQALCIKAETEYYRSLRSEAGAYTMGTLYWQLNDIWPAPTWASIEYGGRWKMLHYYAARFYAPFIVPVYERPIGTLNVYATSDLTDTESGSLTVSVVAWATGETVASFPVSYSVPALSSQRVFSTNITNVIPSQFNRSEVFIQVTGSLGSLSASNVYYPSPLKNVTLLPPAISAFNFTAINDNSASVTIKSSAVAPFVFLSTSLPGTFSDNGFLLLPDSPLTVTFSGWSAFDVSQLAQSLQVKSLFDSYAADHAAASAVM